MRQYQTVRLKSRRVRPSVEKIVDVHIYQVYILYILDRILTWIPTQIHTRQIVFINDDMHAGGVNGHQTQT